MKSVSVTNLLAGRLTPAAKVAVQASRHRMPAEYASSILFLSSFVRPLW